MLEPDGLRRGRGKTHVFFHQKLAKHRTLIDTAIPFVDALISLAEVRQLSLGKIYVDRNYENMGLWINAQSDRLRLAIGDGQRLQIIWVYPRHCKTLPLIVAQLKEAAKKNSLACAEVQEPTDA